MSTNDLPEKIRASASMWIGSADTKATALLTVAGALLAVLSVVPALAGTANFGTVEKGLLVAFCALSVVSIICAGLTLWPRTNRLKLLGEGKHLERSPTFFGDIAQMTFKEFVGAQSILAGDLERDVQEQAYVISKIAAAKMCWMRASIAFLLTALVVLGVLVAYTGTEVHAPASAPATTAPTPAATAPAATAPTPTPTAPAATAPTPTPTAPAASPSRTDRVIR